MGVGSHPGLFPGQVKGALSWAHTKKYVTDSGPGQLECLCSMVVLGCISSDGGEEDILPVIGMKVATLGTHRYGHDCYKSKLNSNNFFSAKARKVGKLFLN